MASPQRRRMCTRTASLHGRCTTASRRGSGSIRHSRCGPCVTCTLVVFIHRFFIVFLSCMVRMVLKNTLAQPPLELSEQECPCCACSGAHLECPGHPCCQCAPRAQHRAFHTAGPSPLQPNPNFPKIQPGTPRPLASLLTRSVGRWSAGHTGVALAKGRAGSSSAEQPMRGRRSRAHIARPGVSTRIQRVVP